jgi:hypothetical protein
MRTSPHSCQKDHNNVVAEALEDLPPSQRSPQRHKCAACAYERGLQEGFKQGTQEARKLVLAALRQSANIRIEDCICPNCGDLHLEGSHMCRGEDG